jgi:hypothetical protein
MKIVKVTAIVSLLTMLCASNANAWGKKEQGFLLGAAAVLTLPHLIDSRHHYKSNVYTDRRYYDGGHHYRYAPNVVHAPTIVKVEQSKPQIIYVETNKEDANIPMHRKIKSHNYIYSDHQPTRVIIEHADGSATVVER